MAKKFLDIVKEQLDEVDLEVQLAHSLAPHNRQFLLAPMD